MGSIKIAPSVLSADMANLKGELDKIAGADYVHFDVMDGHFTGNLTFGVDILKAVKRSTDVPVDAHLMVSNPDETVDWYADAGADMITVHYEASTHLHRTLTHLQQRGVKAGVVLNPATPVCVLESIIDVVVGVGGHIDRLAVREPQAGKVVLVHEPDLARALGQGKTPQHSSFATIGG